MPYSIFVAHPSALLTDHRPHGDGLLAHRFISELAQRGHRLDVAAEEVDLARPLPSHVVIHELGTARPRHPEDRLRHMWRLRRLFERLQQRQQFDLIHQLNPVHVGLTLALTRCSTPIVLGPYVPDWPDLFDPATARPKQIVSRLQQRRAAAILLSSPAARRRVSDPNAGPRLHELAYGVDSGLFSPLPGPPGEEILFAGRLHAHKGVFDLLAAFERVAAAHPRARLTIVGSGPAERELQARVGRSSAAGRIRLTGVAGRDQTIAAMRACAVFCLPSIGEPFGMSALEAMACGKPVVATAAGGLRYLVDPDGGLLVPPGDAVALAQALGELLQNRPRRDQMGRHNRQVIEQRYSWPRVIDRLEAVYAQILA